MLSTVHGSVVVGINAFLVEIEVDVSPGLPGFYLVGLPESAVKESRERVRAAIKNCGYAFPTQRITANLAPADIKKEGTGLDLPLALAILMISGTIPKEAADGMVFCGELSLDGSIRPARGVLPIGLSMKEMGKKALVVPQENAGEAAVVKGLDVYPVRHLAQVVEFLRGETPIERSRIDLDSLFSCEQESGPDFSDVIGQETAKRALEVAAAGGHNVSMVGPPGSGKTMLARRLPSILPPLTFEEALETTCIYSVAGLLPKDTALITRRPFCSPHHTISDAGIIGGGTIPRPGQVSLAHNGVLFLDELPEFKKNCLESLRQPMEDGYVTISRAAMTLEFPSRFTLVAAQNPCPCGHLGQEGHACSCTASQIHRYRTRISGPLLDRIDIQLEVPAVPYNELSSARRGEPSSVIRKRVMEARQIQESRFREISIFSNAQMSARDIRKYCALDRECSSFLEEVSSRLKLSARAYHRIIKIARTIADLAGTTDIQMNHLAEAVQYRSFDRDKNIV